jgi:hypothetical protein
MRDTGETRVDRAFQFWFFLSDPDGPHRRRVQRLTWTVAACGCLIACAIGLILHVPQVRSNALTLFVDLIIIRVLATVAYKGYEARIRRHAQRLAIIEKIGSDSAFAREILDSLRLASANQRHLSPDVASAVDDDPFLKETWKDAHDELQRLYSILGSPPMKTLTGARSA